MNKVAQAFGPETVHLKGRDLESAYVQAPVEIQLLSISNFRKGAARLASCTGGGLVSDKKAIEK